MRQNEITGLMQRYFTACKNGAEPYFDADEIDAILDSFEEKEDFTHYETILALGLRLHPSNTDLKIHQCRFLVYNEKYKQALDLIDNIAEVNNQHLDMLRLECYCMIGEYPKAVEYLEKRVDDARCDYLETLFGFLAPTLIDLEMTTEASDLIRWGLRMFPDNLLLKDEQCYLYELEGNFKEGIRVCNELIDKEPYSYDYWFMLGRFYSLANDFDNAIDAFDFALTCDESDSELKILKAYCLFMNENYDKALEVYSEVENEEDVSTDYLKSLVAECHIKLENYEQAYQMLKEILTQQKVEINDAFIYISFIRCCIETDRENEASQMLIKAADIFPDNVRILSLLALNYLENGKAEKALQIGSKILESLSSSENMESYEALLRDGDSLLSNSILSKAAQYYQELLQIIPQLPVQSQNKYIPPEDLTKEYLNDKNNSN